MISAQFVEISQCHKKKQYFRGLKSSRWLRIATVKLGSLSDDDDNGNENATK